MKKKKSAHKSATTKKPDLCKEDCYQGVHPLLKTYFGYCFSKAAQKYKSLLAKRLAAYKIVSPQLGIMRLLHLQGPASQISLGQDMNIDKASMVKFIDGLEKNRWVQRIPDRQDRRIKLVALTAKGADTLAELSEAHHATVAEFLAPLSKKERDQLQQLIGRLT